MPKPNNNTSQVYYKQNRLKQLRAFCRAAEANNITKAAATLCLTQPTVSLQIQALEREYDTVLFERRGPAISLTPEGEVLYRLAAPLTTGIDGLKETFDSHCGKIEAGNLNIAAGETTILYILPQIMKHFATDYPGINLRLHNVTGRDGMELLRSDEVDFAVGSFLEVPAGIHYHPTMSYKPMLITALDHPLAAKKSITLDDISPYGLVLPPRHLSTWRVVNQVFKQHGVDYKVALEAGGWEVVKKYVALGLGISIVTEVCLSDENRLKKFSLEKYFPERSYGVVVREGKFLSPQAKRFIDMMDPDYFTDTREDISLLNHDS